MNMSRHMIGMMVLSAAMLTGCGREDAAANKAAADAKIEAELRDADAAKAKSNAKIKADLMAADAAKDAADREAEEARDIANRKASDAKAAADRAADDAREAAQVKADAAAKVASDAKSVADAKADADAKIASDAKATADAKAADAAAKVVVDENTARANSLLDQLTQYIKDNKLELAQTTLGQLDGMKGSLPTALQQRIETARAALSAKQSASSMLR